MVMAELVRRGIYFEHTPQRNTLGGAVDPTWEPDFLVPQHRIWIEVQGSYFHSLKNQIELDSFRYAAIKQRGWLPLFWWEFDIRTRLQELMDAVPAFYMVKPPVEKKARSRYGTRKGSGLPFLEPPPGLDHLKGLRAALAGRRKPAQFIYRHRIAGERHEK
jgi:G:T-mismatch repair DNA endonuclease (very short patch repair protein)